MLFFSGVSHLVTKDKYQEMVDFIEDSFTYKVLKHTDKEVKSRFGTIETYGKLTVINSQDY